MNITENEWSKNCEAASQLFKYIESLFIETQYGYKQETQTQFEIINNFLLV